MAHGEAIAEGGALGGAAVGDGRGQAADQARPLVALHGVDGTLRPDGLLQVQRQSSGRHCGRGVSWMCEGCASCESVVPTP